MTMVSVEHEQPALSGTFSFDGETFERFGFNELFSVRIPLALIESVDVSFESGLLKTPRFEVSARGGHLGLSQGLIDPSDDEKVQLQALAEEIRAAIGARAS